MLWRCNSSFSCMSQRKRSSNLIHKRWIYWFFPFQVVLIAWCMCVSGVCSYVVPLLFCVWFWGLSWYSEDHTPFYFWWGPSKSAWPRVLTLQECISPCLVLLCIFVAFHIACRYAGVWLERCEIAYFIPTFASLFSFSCNFWNSHPLDISSHLYASMSTSVLHSLPSVSTPITGSPTPERRTLFLLTCLLFSTDFWS